MWGFTEENANCDWFRKKKGQITIIQLCLCDGGGGGGEIRIHMRCQQWVISFQIVRRRIKNDQKIFELSQSIYIMT